MIGQFIVYLMNAMGVKSHIVNCANAESARFICEGMFPNMRVIEVAKVA